MCTLPGLHTCPPLPRSTTCRYDQGGHAQAADALSRQGGGGRADRRICLAQIKEEGLGQQDKPDWVAVSGARERWCWGAWKEGLAGCAAGWLAGPQVPFRGACQPGASLSTQMPALPLLSTSRPLLNSCPQVTAAITYLRSENMCYPACTNKVDGTRQCNKKLQDNGDGTWCVCMGDTHVGWECLLSNSVHGSGACTVFQGSTQAAKPLNRAHSATFLFPRRMCERCGGNFEPEYRYNLSLTVGGLPWACALQVVLAAGW